MAERLFVILNSAATEEDHRDIEQFRKELKNVADISEVIDRSNKNTLLHEACYLNSAYLARVILSLKTVNESFIQKQNKKWISALEIAKENGNVAIQKTIEAAILRNRAKQFATKLLEQYQKKIQKYRSIASGENVPNSGNSGFSVTMRYAVSIFKCAPVPGAGALATGASEAAGDIWQVTRRRKANKIWNLHNDTFYANHAGNKLPKKLIELLVRDGLEIFSSFEHYFNINAYSYTEWNSKMDTLASQCVNRIMSYIYTQWNLSENSSLDEPGVFSKCFMMMTPSLLQRDSFRGAKNTGIIILAHNGMNEFYKQKNTKACPEKFHKMFKFEEDNNILVTNYEKCIPESVNSSDFVLENHIINCIEKEILYEKGILSEFEVLDDDAYYEDNSIPVPEILSTVESIEFGLSSMDVDSFAGRHSEIHKITEFWSGSLHGKSVDMVIITQSQLNQAGCCGIGKTELVKKFSHDLRKTQRVNVVILNGANLEEEFVRLYDRIIQSSANVPQEVSTIENVPHYQLVKLCLKSLNKHNPTLFVILNAECTDNVQEFLPSSSLINIRTMLTTRLTSMDGGNFKGRTVERLELKALSEADCEQLMGVMSSQAEIKRLASVLDYSPLALRQTKEYIFEQQRIHVQLKPQQVVKNVVDGYIRALFWEKSEFTEDAVGIYKQTVNGKNLFKCWDDVFKNLAKHGAVGEVALKIVEFTAYMMKLPLFIKSFLKYDNEEVLNQAIALLKSYNILREDGSEDMWNICKIVKKKVRFQNNIVLGVEHHKLDAVLQHWTHLISGETPVLLTNDYIRHIVFAWSYAKHYNELVDKYIVKEDYTKPGNYFLHIILQHDEYDSVEMLLSTIQKKIGNDEKQKKKIARSKFLVNGCTPLHLSATIPKTHVRKKAVKMFMGWGGADGVRDKDYVGDTPVHKAFHFGNLMMGRKMLEKCPDAKHERNEAGLTPQDVIPRQDSKDVGEYDESINTRGC